MISDTWIAAIVIGVSLLVAIVAISVFVAYRHHRHLEPATARRQRLGCSGANCCKSVQINHVSSVSDIRKASKALSDWASRMKSNKRRNDAIEMFGPRNTPHPPITITVCAMPGMSIKDFDAQVATGVKSLAQHAIVRHTQPTVTMHMTNMYANPTLPYSNVSYPPYTQPLTTIAPPGTTANRWPV